MKTREDWNYYDGPLAGMLWEEGKPTRYFMIRDDDGPAMYPTAPEGRLYDVWILDVEPNADDIEDAWWWPGRPPDGSITENEVYEYLHV